MVVMDLRIMTEPQQGASYDTRLALAKASEAAGFSGYFRSDHYLTMSGDGLPGPTDAWVAQVEQMSGGRVELGLGAGWFEAEHRAYGIPFPSARLGRLEEQLAIVTGLWSTPPGETFSYAGKYYQLTDSPGLPKPAQSHVPIIVGGNGPTRTPAIAAAYADEFNVPFQPVANTAAQFGRVREAAAGRDLTYSAAVTTCVGKDDAEVARRAAAIGREVDDLKTNGAAGTPAEVAETLSQFAEAGASRIYLQLLDMTDLDHVDLIASDVRPQLG